jgi:Fe-Mn family superoxide dismutase
LVGIADFANSHIRNGATMAISLLPLPYADSALDPTISAVTLQTHHGKHHKAYVDKTNAAIEGTDLAGKSLEEIVAAAQAKGDKGLFNNSAQTWNHGFYWHSLTAETTEPTGDLAAAIEASFGTLDALKAELAAQGAAHFASGWVWLVAKDGKLVVEQTHDAATYSDLSAPAARDRPVGTRLLRRLQEPAPRLPEGRDRKAPELGFRCRELRSRLGLGLPGLIHPGPARIETEKGRPGGLPFVAQALIAGPDRAGPLREPCRCRRGSGGGAGWRRDRADRPARSGRAGTAVRQTGSPRGWAARGGRPARSA